MSETSWARFQHWLFCPAAVLTFLTGACDGVGSGRDSVVGR